MAAKNGHEDAVRAITPHYLRPDATREAARDYDEVVRDGRTCLMMLAALPESKWPPRMPRVVAALLDAKADPTMRDAEGRTALDHAQPDARERIARMLDRSTHRE